MAAYAAKLLRIDLSSGQSRVETLDEKTSRKHMGGKGIGARVLFEEVPAGADPLGPENRLVIAAGPLAGTYAPGSGRLGVYGKSPLTGVFGEAYSGGAFAHELRYAGFDALVVHGKASGKVYLHIHDGSVEIRDASHLWGKEMAETERAIRDELGDGDYRIAGIGPAGEKMVRFACVMNDTDRAAGRTGLGAVLGSKGLKAIAVRGLGGVRVAEPEAFRTSASLYLAKVRASPIAGFFSALGTSGMTEGQDQAGGLPTRNWDSGTFADASKISGSAMKASILIGHRACMACPIGCTRVVTVKDGPFAGVRPEYGGPEYEAVAALGSLCGNGNLEAIAMANQKCNAYGLDVISTGAAVAFAMDCAEHGVLSEKAVGFPLHWGDAEALVKLVELIGRREGIGDVLADGVARAAARIGGDAPSLAVHVKGLDPGMHESRMKKGLAFSYATSPRGATHMEGYHDSPAGDPRFGIPAGLDPYTLAGKGKVVAPVENYSSFVNSVPVCSFVGPSFTGAHDEFAGMLAAATGWNDLSFQEELAVGERNHNLARAFTARESDGKPDDRLPPKLAKALEGGKSAGQRITAEEMAAALQEYYAARGWDRSGVPTRAKLVELGLEGAAAALHGKGA
jgi:aldehyde:ferredoxin oxidoreductase